MGQRPAIPSGMLNCMSWLQWVIAKTYSNEEDGAKAALDRLRYYDGQIAWGTRKHYIDHWLAVEPSPLVPLDLSRCDGFAEREIHLDFKLFKSTHGYGCDLYREDVNVIPVQYVVADCFRRCCEIFSYGYYIVFPVAGANYMKNKIRFTGPMGLVHSLVLRVKPDIMSSVLTIVNPSTDARRVTVKGIDEYLKASRRLFDGYAVYTLDPTWEFTEPVPKNDAIRRIVACERRLPRRSRPAR